MSTDCIYVPMSRKLYNDVIRLTDGQIDPAAMAAFQLERWIERDLESGDGDYWGDRFEEAAEIYAPHLLEVLAKTERAALVKQDSERKPLVWKEITVPAGSEVRMSYGGTHHYAIIADGRIVDNSGAYSPSDWARKVANNTSRNAWRDLWFREPLSKAWVPAQLLRDQAQQEANAPRKHINDPT